MRLTTRTNLAMRTLMVCAVNPGETVRKSDVARLCNASENHLGQVVRFLAHFGYITALRGRHGGIQLACPPEEINVGAVFRMFEFDHPFAECFEGAENTCPLVECCWLRKALERAVEAFYQSLDRLSLRDLVESNDELQQVLCMPEMGFECGRNGKHAVLQVAG
ncbi:MAG: Rrf2 family transcriptional regulator [Nitratireductor sp.]|nr:Rrf2 family transcriptional regulator [Nitratireductor sp.]